MFSITLSQSTSRRPGVILIKLTSNHDQELLIHIVDVKIKRTNDPNYCSLGDFRIMTSVITDKNFRIDLDPFEVREYGILINETKSFNFEITARDAHLGCESKVSGRITGSDPPAGYVELSESSATSFDLGCTVLPKAKVSSTDKFVISSEDGTPNDFGIFDKDQLNPTAAYIELGRDGYRELIGQHIATLSWDRDTVAYPPDDLVAIHISNSATKEHGWYFRGDLLFLR
jgi:hypothetical protein